MGRVLRCPAGLDDGKDVNVLTDYDKHIDLIMKDGKIYKNTL